MTIKDFDDRFVFSPSDMPASDTVDRLQASCGSAMADALCDSVECGTPAARARAANVVDMAQLYLDHQAKKAKEAKP